MQPTPDSLAQLTSLMNRQQTQRRAAFLRPPPELRAPVESGRTRRNAESAQRMLDQLLERETPPSLRNGLIEEEAKHSSAIENEFGQDMLARHAEGLRLLLDAPATQESMLQAHALMMQGQARAQPGRYRSVRVRVGRHAPPEPAAVPELMDGLYRYVQESGDCPVVKAAWAHQQFETIHPFADGNGRTGRGLITQLLGFPVPLSRWILKRRFEYYAALDQYAWNSYLDWFLRGLSAELRLLEQLPQE